MDLKESVHCKTGLPVWSVLVQNYYKAYISRKFLEKTTSYLIKITQLRITGDFFEDWNEITPQIHVRKFEEQTT